MTELVGLPMGTSARAAALARSAATSLSSLLERSVVVDAPALIDHLMLPRRLGESRESPSPAVAVGDGFVHLDLTADDRATFDRLRALRPDATAEELSAEAQTWRLPVTPYRSSFGRPGNAEWSVPAVRDGSAPPIRHRLRVVDMTTMWAGPLATHLLASVGAEVVTVEPRCRPDGLRGSPRHFAALAIGKRRVDLDLRRTADRARFESLLQRADLLVESFSRRVLPNFGYDADELRRRHPRLVVVGIRAFGGEGIERDWVAYGPGVHATVGPSIDAAGCPRPAALAYADPLAGLATLAVAAAVAGRADEVPPLVEVALADQVCGLGPVLDAQGFADGPTGGCASPSSVARFVRPLVHCEVDS